MTTTKSKIKVRKNVPLPPPSGRNEYPMLEVGQSFFAPGKQHNDLAGVIANRKRKYKQKHVCRIVTEKGVRGLCVWREV